VGRAAVRPPLLWNPKDESMERLMKQYLLASDFDQTLSFNDSAWC
jgi:hypothetical protein